MTASQHSRPALHNAMWPGLVGKGSPGAEPFIDLDTMLDLTAQANVDGIRFDGVDLFLSDPHTSIDASDEELKRLHERWRAVAWSWAHWWLQCGRRLAAARRWGATRIGKSS